MLVDQLHSDPSPIQLVLIQGREVYVKRDDQLPAICTGNKFRKLKYNLIEARKRGANRLLSFGGAFSNHLVALSKVGKALNWPTIGIIRGEEDVSNPSIQQMRANGMRLQFVARSTYRKRHDPDYLKELQEEYPNAYIIPEGGSNALALVGIKELVQEVMVQIDSIDHWICAVGTGATAAGILQAIPAKSSLIAINVLPKIDQRKAIESFLEPECWIERKNQLKVIEFRLGKFGGYVPEIEGVLNAYRSKDLALDPLYTARAMYTLQSLIGDNYFSKSSSILFVHTGGLQGLAGYNYRFNKPSSTKG